MKRKLFSLGIVAALAVILCLGIAAITYSEVGVTSRVEADEFPMSVCNLSAVPQSVAEDAIELAGELFGDYQERYDDFVNQLLVDYLEAEDKDFVVVFNPGGWGWNLLEASPGWYSIFTGIESELDDLGYTSLLLNYQRTTDSLRGRLNELVKMVTGYSSKAKDLVYRVEFLTDHVPELRVIIAGESNGTIISDYVMSILGDNQQVYSIQTGPPFWHKNIVLARTLLLTDNGITPDSFSRGDFLAMIRGNLKALFGLSQPEDDYGTILHFVDAPGHDYWWQYPEVRLQITNFLEQNFGTK